MKVATLWFERTLHRHCRTLKTSAGISIFMSCLTFTWQDNRTPSRTSPRLIWLSSVGRTAPPPSSTLTVHTPQLPFPPHADGMKILLSASVPSSVLPALVWSAFSGSSFTTMVTSPVDTSCRRATINRPTRDTMVNVNIITPRVTVTIYSCTPANAMKPIAISPTRMNVNPNPRRAGGGLL